MKKITFLFVILFSITGSSQSKGDRYRNEGDLAKAIEVYKTDYEKNPSDARNTYNLACAYALTYQKGSAFQYLNIALKNDNSLWAPIEGQQLSKPRDRKTQNPE